MEHCGRDVSTRFHRGVPFDPNCLEALRVTIAFGQDGRRTPEGNQDRTGQVPRYHAGEDGPLPYVPTQEPFGPTTTSELYLECCC